MDYVRGKTLEAAWGDLNEDQKTAIAGQLYRYFAQLRALKGLYIGGLEGGPTAIGSLFPIEGGRFPIERQFNEFILSDLRDSVPDLLRYCATFALEDHHDIIFTHGDLAPRNIMVDGGKITAISDLELAGWYPEYWEYKGLPGLESGATMV